MNGFGKIIEDLNNIVWSTPLVALCLIAGVYLSLRMKFPQVRLFKDMIKFLFSKEKSESGVTPFQAFATTVGGRVGVGNIAGVATAIFYGGPGALFWMWILAFLGSASAFTESTLAQAYKTKISGEYVGGPAYFIEEGIGKKWYAIAFALCTILAPGILMPSAQTYNIASSLNKAFGINEYIIGVLLLIALALVIFGGIKRIGKIAQLLAPLMATGYFVIALIIIILNIKEVPATFALIFSSAFGINEMFGGIIGAAISWGVKRGVYSSEAGQGSGAIVSAAAETSHPAKQGLVQGFSVYIDTIIVCTATGLMILLTGSYNTIAGDGSFVIENVPGIPFGVEYTQTAVDSVFNNFGSGFVAISILLFAFTSLMSYYYQAESNMNYIFPGNKTAITVLRVLFLIASFYGVFNTGKMIWTFGDLGVGLMAWLNIIAILLLSKKAIEILKDYEEQKKLGIDPVFDPDKFNIKDKANIWRNYKKQSKYHN